MLVKPQFKKAAGECDSSHRRKIRTRAALDKGAYRRTIGGVRIMREELDHLLTLAEAPEIVLV